MEILKCKVCGFSENESKDTICVKCGEPLELMKVEEPSVSYKIPLKETLRDRINTEKKKTRILDKKEKDLFSTIDTKPNGQTKEIDVNPQSEHLKRTMYVDDFLKPRDINLKFELLPLGEEVTGSPIKGFEEEVILSRKHIDAEDYSISSQDHIKISKEEGKWILENTSSNGAVFIRVVDKIEIKENDIIIIGKNKTFLFKPK
jgi:hypothetical protein